MSDGWQVGDLALCVNDDPCGNSGAACPCELGRIYRVSEIAISRSGHVGLRFNGIHFPHARLDAIYHARFRKIRPDEHEPCEEEFVTLLKRNRVSA